MNETLLTKPLLHNSIAEAVYKEITTRTGKYYYFIGTVIDPVDQNVSAYPTDNLSYERFVRNNMVLVKEIKPSDVSFVVKRINWEPNRVFDMFDDSYSDKVLGINLLSGGENYTANANIIIEDGGGVDAKAELEVYQGKIVNITLVEGGDNYTSKPNVIIQDSVGSGAVAEAVMNFTHFGANSLSESLFYVLTDNNNIYKCLDNNGGSTSKDKPIEVTSEPFITDDGYKWKFVAQLPTFLTNKFLTKYTMPVLNSLSNQFYSKGEIKNIVIQNSGYDYTFAHLDVIGDGFIESEPLYVRGFNITNVGDSYTEANVIISPPVGNHTSWLEDNYFNVGKVVKTNTNNFYEVMNNGNTGAFEPVHITGIVQNGDVDLKFLGQGITATLDIESGEIANVSNLYGIVSEIIITNSGSGYITSPSITFDGDGSNANAYTSITNGNVSKINLISGGDSFSVAPNIIIGEEWQEFSNVTTNQQLFYSNNLYTVTVSGQTGNVAPTHIDGTEINGTSELEWVGLKASGFTKLKYGIGYSSDPIVTVEGDGNDAIIVPITEKSKALLIPVIENGRIVRVLVDEGGIGYSTATINIIGDGEEASFIINMSKGDLTTIQSTSELLAVDGAIHAIKVVSGGYGYNDAEAIIEGDGTGAAADIQLLNGKVHKIKVTNEGKNYTWVKISIVGDGRGARARAILPPIGGHGKNIIHELFARKLAFYSTIGNERNQGIVVDNEYRQYGIIKDIEDYDRVKFFNSEIGSACWLIYSENIDISKFKDDVVVKRVSDDVEFLIVSSTETKLLLISLSNKKPEIGDILIEESLTTISIKNVVEPDINKFSGKMLLVDNRVEFTTTNEQSLALRTIIKY
jgi:hypothetical protein